MPSPASVPPGARLAPRRITLALLSLAVATLLGSGDPPAAMAGQVQVTVNSNFFNPRAVNCNLGDHVVWVWLGSSHTVTSGDSSTATPDGKFDSGLMGVNSSFSWKSNSLGLVIYFCQPHAPNMAGRVIVASSGIAVADFRITRVQYNRGSTLGLFEIANLGNAQGDLGRYRIATSNGATTVPLNSFVVPAGKRVIVHVNKSGTNAPPDSLFLPALVDLPTGNGSLALYVPNSAAGHTSLTDATQIIDFLEWGTTAGLANEATAAAAGIWQAGQALQGLGTGNAFEFCGASKDYGPSFWHQVRPVSFGSNTLCATAAERTTWGRIKLLYR